MGIKTYQIVDTVHGVIYYTKLEKQIINTPFFNRLHDVNQNSTVYLTFPPNRTKRYEHSLGTMQLTSDVFCHAAMNSVGNEGLEALMNKAEDAFKDVLAYIRKGDTEFIFTFPQKTLVSMDYLRNKEETYIMDMIADKFPKLFQGDFLLNYVPYKYKANKFAQTGCEDFLFLCLLQSLRIIGLLHDIGHPPQSHIIESVIEEIDYELRKSKTEPNERQNKFLKILSSYKDPNNKNIKKLDAEMAIKRTGNVKKEELHEMIGIQIMKHIVKYVFLPLMANSLSGDETRQDEDAIYTLYYYTVIEFIFAIVRNKNNFWIGLHSIVDGTIDTDRLDFVSRDSQNSGMVWGRVPYKRLVNTVRFGKVFQDGIGESVYVCFLDKNIQQMDDLLHDRYKIFTTINYHHHSTKIACLFQKAVKLMAMEYLSSPEPDTEKKGYFSDISGLWRTIEDVYAEESFVFNLIQWNDSWLNELLYRRMIQESRARTEISECCKFLREIFLNENHYYSLIKRQTEVSEINDEAAVVISNTLIQIEKQILIEENELNIPGKKEDNKADIGRRELYNYLLDLHDALINFDWSAIEMLLRMEIVSDAIERVMSRHEKEIDSYFIKRVKFSLGIGNAYVCDYDNNVESYYKYSNIEDVLKKSRFGFPYFYIYFKKVKPIDLGDTFLSDIRKEIGRELGEIIMVSVRNNIQFD